MLLNGAEKIWEGGPMYLHKSGVFKPGSDSVLLGRNARLDRVRSVCELGCGGGIISVILLHRNPGLSVTCLDISPAAASLTRTNLDINGFTANVICGDLRKIRELLPAGSFDLVISNPPYYAVGQGIPPSDPDRAAARAEDLCVLADICGAAAYLLRWGGRFSLVYKPERLCELFHQMSTGGIEPKYLRPVQYRVNTPPSMLLVEGRRGGNTGLSFEPPLLLARNNTEDTQ